MEQYIVIDRDSKHMWVEDANTATEAIRQADSSRRLNKDRNCPRKYSVAKTNDMDTYRVNTDVRKIK